MGDRYTAMPELRCTFGDRSIGPDVAVIAWKRVALTDEGEPIAPGMDRLSCDLTEVGYCSSNRKGSIALLAIDPSARVVD